MIFLCVFVVVFCDYFKKWLLINGIVNRLMFLECLGYLLIGKGFCLKRIYCELWLLVYVFSKVGLGYYND